jgi:hypothetical protein
MIHGKSYIPLDFTAMAPGMLLNPASGLNGTIWLLVAGKSGVS